MRQSIPCVRAFVCALVLSAGLTPFNSALAQSPDLGRDAAASARESTLSSSGNARVSRAPDFVDVMVGVVVFEKSASAAQAGADKAMSAAVSAVKKLGLSNSELQTGSVELSPKYERKDNNTDEMVIIGYAATMTLRVRTSELTSVAKIVDAALAAGCNRVDFVQFGIKEALNAREEAIRLATQAAKRKAEVLADALGLKLGRVVDASTTSNQWGGWQNNRMSQMSSNMQTSGGSGSGEDAVVPGKVEVWADTNLTFTLVGK